jgi:hypothetical protein
VAPSQRSCEDQVEDRRVDVMDYVGPCHTYFVIFYVLDTMDIIVFYLDL